MSDHQDPVRLTIGVVATIGLLAMAVVTVFSVREYSAVNSPSLIATHDRSAEGRELERCRTITPQQYASDDACRRAWAEQRRRFFESGQEGSEAPITIVPTSPSQSSEPPTETTNKLNAPHPTLTSPQKD
jgi:conjugative transfer region protein TrbK